MTFILAVKDKYAITALKVGNFSIPEKIKGNVKIEGDISTINSWKVKVVLANSTSEDDAIGKWEDVGYVGFLPTKGILVPIARADEHNTGHELLYHYMDKGLIPKCNYTTIWVRTGPNYAYDAKHIEKLIPIYKKWLELGGENLRINTQCNRISKYLSFEDLVNGKAGIEHPSGALSTFGKELVDLLEKIAVLYKKALTSQKMRPPLKAIANEMLNLAEFFKKHSLTAIPQIEEGTLEKAASNILNGENLDENMKPIFGFKGIKNEMHTTLKDLNKPVKKEDKYSWERRDYSQFFGDLKFALEAFNRISAI